MKGILLSIFTDMIEEKYGYEILEEIIDKADLESEAIYLRAGTYSSEELFLMSEILSKKIKISISELLVIYGEFAFRKLIESYPQFVENKKAKEFLSSVDQVIHAELKKIYPKAKFPNLRVEDSDSTQLTIYYSSKRNLPSLMKGLIQGASIYFKEKISINVSVVHTERGETYKFKLKFE